MTSSRGLWTDASDRVRVGPCGGPPGAIAPGTGPLEGHSIVCAQMSVRADTVDPAKDGRGRIIRTSRSFQLHVRTRSKAHAGRGRTPVRGRQSRGGRASCDGRLACVCYVCAWHTDRTVGCPASATRRSLRCGGAGLEPVGYAIAPVTSVPGQEVHHDRGGFEPYRGPTPEASRGRLSATEKFEVAS